MVINCMPPGLHTVALVGFSPIILSYLFTSTSPGQSILRRVPATELSKNPGKKNKQLETRNPIQTREETLC
ncbi:uncharacterized protein BO66DRAFT_176674 [Aspergillus aculeatinus CBS 121060]|uniref:Uncharacterized protein n=1 Tax=Aspergillus aculeatinus CBS 121060 TaxID=1448322 RepID=A0ACD1HK21_9EURO|nr:hypothetical protein BO66DRAFT_176674 [Aspergillus aculeatinus CBS 121060]RAH73931.1 hypothetical protein BO66DRAFT_176674 [Aspergillus aculeatinus CBS 121060]